MHNLKKNVIFNWPQDPTELQFNYYFFAYHYHSTQFYFGFTAFPCSEIYLYNISDHKKVQFYFGLFLLRRSHWHCNLSSFIFVSPCCWQASLMIGGEKEMICNFSILSLLSVSTQAIQFFTNTKTVTQLWRGEDASDSAVATAMPVQK